MVAIQKKSKKSQKAKDGRFHLLLYFYEGFNVVSLNASRKKCKTFLKAFEGSRHFVPVLWPVSIPLPNVDNENFLAPEDAECNLVAIDLEDRSLLELSNGLRKGLADEVAMKFNASNPDFFAFRCLQV